MEIAATGDAAARRVASSASQHVESVKALHARMVLMMVMSLEMTQTLTPKAFDIVE
jgi:hypothetical protein